MKICFPVEKFDGLESKVYGHFGSAPVFVMVDSETLEVERLNNGDLGHEHGSCNPLKALGGTTVKTLVVGGIGQGALNKLVALGTEVYRAESGSVGHNMALYKDGKLSKFNPMLVCKGHGGGCSH